MLLDVLSSFWQSLSDMSAYLLLGFLLSGILSLFITPTTVQKHLGKPGFFSILKATLFGIPLPLCSCTVIPVAISLRKQGASKGATIGFLISTPQTGIDSILVTWGLLGPLFAIVRPIVAFFSGLIGGLAVDIFCDTTAEEIQPITTQRFSIPNKFLYILQYGFGTLAGDIAKPLAIGLVISASFGVLISPEFFSHTLAKEWYGMFLMLFVSIPLYVCATGSVPIVATLIAKGISPGSALVFLMTGPATNSATIATIWKTMGKKTAVVYVITISLCAILAGLCLDFLLLTKLTGYVTCSSCKLLPNWLNNISAVVLILVLGYGCLRPYITQYLIIKKTTYVSDSSRLFLLVSSLKCNGCAQRVADTIRQNHNVTHVHVDYPSGLTSIYGTDLDADTLIAQIRELNFSVSHTNT